MRESDLAAGSGVSSRFLQGAVCQIDDLSGVVVDASRELLVGFPQTRADVSSLPRVGRLSTAAILLEDGRQAFDLPVTAVRRVDSPTSVTLVGFRPERALPSFDASGGLDLRGESRVTPGAGRAALVNIEADGRVTAGLLADISISGIGIIVEPDAEEHLAAARVVHLEIWFKGEDQPVTVDAVIQHRRLQTSKQLLYGLRFLVDEASPAPLGVVRYVLSRQMEDAEDPS